METQKKFSGFESRKQKARRIGPSDTPRFAFNGFNGILFNFFYII